MSREQRLSSGTMNGLFYESHAGMDAITYDDAARPHGYHSGVNFTVGDFVMDAPKTSNVHTGRFYRVFAKPPVPVVQKGRGMTHNPNAFYEA